MSELLVKSVVKKEPGYLYFVDQEGNVCRAKMARGVKLSPAEKTKREAERKQRREMEKGARRAIREKILAEARKRVKEEYKKLK
jgi:hypothetical protein